MKKQVSVVLSVLLFTVVLMGCTSTMTPTEFITGETKEYIIPEIGIESTAFLGDSLIREGKTVKQDEMTLYKSFGTPSFTSYHPTGNYTLIGKKDDSNIYQFDTMFSNGWTSCYPQLIEDANGIVYRKTIAGKIELKSTDYQKKQVLIDNSGSYEQNLIYTGSEGDILKFTYREFVDDMARPAFTIDATYDYGKDNVLRFRGALLEVINFDNQSITYKLISGFKN
jgi:hypothetical protein